MALNVVGQAQVPLPEAQVRPGSAPSPCGPARPHFHFLSKVGLSFTVKIFVKWISWCLTCRSSTHEACSCCCPHAEATWKVLSCHLPLGLKHSSFLMFPLIPVSLHQPIFLQPHSAYGAAAQTFQGCLAACIYHFCMPARPSWVLCTGPLAPLQPFASQSPCLGKAFPPDHERLMKVSS